MSSVPNVNNQGESIPKMYYKPVNEFALEEAKTKILDTLNDALEKEIITKQEFNAITPEDKNQSTFY